MASSNTTTGNKLSDPYTAKNVDEPDLKTKVEDLAAFVESHMFCMMTTHVPNSPLLASRCMAVAGKESNGLDLIFHANSESGKTDDLHSDCDVNLGFVTPIGEWASIAGKATIETDREEIKRYYSEGLRAWLGDLGDGVRDGGPDDPRICLIRVKTVTAQYCVTKKGIIASAIEIAKSVAQGSVPNINKIRHISEEEANQWRSKYRE
ncbi:hypothetical protein P152DRAFT_452043 [Eremomyces bilateralis CBS 781.70]|uniref:General stress protein FMN-binding split barrel domain-containing protein n=1 Tax=Eremomyces bilateralis CBS 781.70 TaxID=1392243 RepID=A0A6G1FUN2_9PEZI|nr:uncharacterized protein P152DRAFT_452043 [Eremomyces bilateralis CBS 781.70]KAF1809361.1 hypothetical protein P152DRAFT_452043 [Eremomyces bilateralis CBS 781.70]